MTTIAIRLLSTATLAVALAACFSVPPAPGGDDGGIDASSPIDAPDAASSSCGNSQKDPGEDCDEGGVDTADCDRDCSAPVCGDGLFNPLAEQCDDGNTNDDNNGCDGQCRKNSVCSDGIVQELFEACDDSNQNNSDGCSADCKSGTASLIPVSDRSGTDSNLNGTIDYIGNEDSTGEAVWYFNEEPSTEEKRLAFELNTAALHPGVFVQSARFVIHTCCLSGTATVQLHGYMANGTVELTDMSYDSLVMQFAPIDEQPQSLDVQTLLQTAADERWGFTGILLRLDIPSVSEFGFNYGIQTSNNADPAKRPALSLAYCVDTDHNAACD